MDSDIAKLGATTTAIGIRVWTGRGESPRPQRDAGHVEVDFGEDLALELLPVIQALDEAFYESDA